METLNKNDNRNKNLLAIGSLTSGSLIASLFLIGNSEMSNLLTSKLGLSVSKAESITAMIDSSMTAAQIAGVITAETGVGLAVGGLAYAIKHLLKKNVKKQIIGL